MSSYDVSKFVLNADNSIFYDGEGLYRLSMETDRTKVFEKNTGREIRMPKAFYNLRSHEGKAEFFHDLLVFHRTYDALEYESGQLSDEAIIDGAAWEVIVSVGGRMYHAKTDYTDGKLEEGATADEVAKLVDELNFDAAQCPQEIFD